MHAKNEMRLPMNRLVAQAFQPAGLPDFRVRWTRNGRLESRPNPQARKPALRTRLGSWSQCAPNMTWRLPMNRVNVREVLDCASPLALLDRWRPKSKRPRAGAVQDAGEPTPTMIRLHSCSFVFIRGFHRYSSSP